MITLLGTQHRKITPEALAGKLRQRCGKSWRRNAPLHQLALLTVLDCLPEERRALPTGLLWQSASGPRQETQVLIDEMRRSGEPLPYDFLATQPALAAPQVREFVPGLCAVKHFPLACDSHSQWSILLLLARQWLSSGRVAQVVCAQLDSWPTQYVSHGLLLVPATADGIADVNIADAIQAEVLDDSADLPLQLATWLAKSFAERAILSSDFGRRIAFRRVPTGRTG